jgi:GNAT superfamily N-acetyltransferase
VIRRLDHANDAEACDAIIASLPEWFGLEEGIREAAEAARTHEGWVIETDGEVVGFLTLVHRYPTTAEVSWMAVHREHRRNGHGRALVDATRQELAAGGLRLLLVKTLSDRVDPGPEYAHTRAFYLANGFVPVMELDIWGPENPCQVLAMPIDAG